MISRLSKVPEQSVSINLKGSGKGEGKRRQKGRRGGEGKGEGRGSVAISSRETIKRLPVPIHEYTTRSAYLPIHEYTTYNIQHEYTMQSLASSFWMFNYIPKHSIDRLHTLGPRTDPFDEGRPLPHRHSPVESGTIPEVLPITRLQKEKGGRRKEYVINLY